MKKTKGIILIFLAIILLPFGSHASLLSIENRCESYLIGDFSSGRILEDYNIDEPMNTASISKLMTYLVVKDQISEGNISLDDRVTITADMEAVGGSNFRLLQGEVLTVEDLLAGLMVVSGNDAAYALAVHTAGSEPAFVEMMNEKADELGLENSHFVNASGLQSENGQNTMTSREIFELSRHIINKYPEILDYGEIRVLNMPERNYVGYTTIPLIGEMAGVDGLKTGFTEEAGYCLVSTMDGNESPANEDYRVITVVMGAESLEERSDLSRYLLEYTMENYHMRTLVDENMPYKELKINSAKSQNVPIYPAESYQILAGKDKNFNYEDNIKEDIKAPLAKGDKLGELRVLDGDEVLVTVDLITRHDIEQAGLATRILRTINTTISRLASMLRR